MGPVPGLVVVLAAGAALASRILEGASTPGEYPPVGMHADIVAGVETGEVVLEKGDEGECCILGWTRPFILAGPGEGQSITALQKSALVVAGGGE